MEDSIQYMLCIIFQAGNPVTWLQTEATHPERLCCTAEGDAEYPCLDPALIEEIQDIIQN